jgi:hypothetical protein
MCITSCLSKILIGRILALCAAALTATSPSALRLRASRPCTVSAPRAALHRRRQPFRRRDQGTPGHGVRVKSQRRQNQLDPSGAVQLLRRGWRGLHRRQGSAIRRDHGPDGRLYGAAAEGGAQNSNCRNGACGVIFELTPNADKSIWTEKLLYVFCKQGAGDCADGANTHSGVRFAFGGLLGNADQGSGA